MILSQLVSTKFNAIAPQCCCFHCLKRSLLYLLHSQIFLLLCAPLGTSHALGNSPQCYPISRLSAVPCFAPVCLNFKLFLILPMLVHVSLILLILICCVVSSFLLPQAVPRPQLLADTTGSHLALKYFREGYDDITRKATRHFSVTFQRQTPRKSIITKLDDSAALGPGESLAVALRWKLPSLLVA